jgi:hypothetical protein
VGRTLLSVAFDLEVDVDVDLEIEVDLILGSLPSRGRTVEERVFSSAYSPQKMKLGFSPEC